MTEPKQPTSIGDMEFDALIEYDEGYESEVPAYSTEEGYSVSDSIIIKPETLNMTLIITDTPVTWKERLGDSSGKADSSVQKLKELYFKKEPVEVTTPSMMYENMAITSLDIKKSSEDGNSYEVSVSLQKIIVTESNTVTIPDSYGKSGTTASSSGTASTKSSSKSSSSSSSASSASASSTTSSSSSSSSSGSSKSGSGGSILYNVAKSFGLL